MTAAFLFYMSRVSLGITVAAGLCCLSLDTPAQETIYRCGNEYTNDASKAQRERCSVVAFEPPVSIPMTSRPLSSAPVARGVKPKPSPSPIAKSPSSSLQSARDKEAQSVIDAEIQKTQAELARLVSQYNAGRSTRLPAEGEAAYAERVTSLKNQLHRAEADLQSLRRERGRLSSPTVPTSR